MKDNGVKCTLTTINVNNLGECFMYPESQNERRTTCSSRPPVGIEPTDIWIARRINDLKNAIIRYQQAGMEVPKEWYDEHFKLVNM